MSFLYLNLTQAHLYAPMARALLLNGDGYEWLMIGGGLVAGGAGGGGAYFRFQNPVHRPKNAGKRHDCGRRRRRSRMGGGGAGLLLQTRENEYFYWVVRKENIEDGERQLGLEGHEEKLWNRIRRAEGLCVKLH